MRSPAVRVPDVLDAVPVGCATDVVGLGLLRGEEPEVVLHAQVVVLPTVQEVQVQLLLRIGERIVRPHAREFGGERAAEADVQGRQPLLAVQDRGDGPVAERTGRRAVGVVALVVVTHEVVEGEAARVVLVDLPHEEGSDGISTHQAVEQPGDLVTRPDELALDRRQHVVAAMNLLQRTGDRNGRLK